jgi:hypothetical protein
MKKRYPMNWRWHPESLQYSSCGCRGRGGRKIDFVYYIKCSRCSPPCSSIPSILRKRKRMGRVGQSVVRLKKSGRRRSRRFRGSTGSLSCSCRRKRTLWSKNKLSASLQVKTEEKATTNRQTEPERSDSIYSPQLNYPSAPRP